MREHLLRTALAVGITSAASGQTTWNGSVSQAWSDAGNWSAGIPGDNSKAYINLATGNTPVVSTAVLKNSTVGGNDLWVGQGSGNTGKLEIASGGSLQTNGSWLFVGEGSGTGTLTVKSGGTLTSDNDVRIGRTSGIGNLNIESGAIVNVNSIVSENAANTMSVAGTATVTTVDATTTHNMKLTGVTGNISLQGGDQRLAAGSNTMGNGVIFDTSGQLFVGTALTSDLTIDAGTGTVNVGAWLPVGIGASGNGTLNLNSGTLTVSDTNATSFTTVGANNNAIGVVTQNGGTWNQLGAGIVLGESGTAQGTFNLKGGDLYTARIWSGNGGGTLNIEGGTLHASANQLDFLSANLVVDLKSTATIDTAGFNVTANAVLGGVGGLTKTGAGTLVVYDVPTYSGATNVSSGALRLGGAAATSGVTVAAGAALGVEDPDDTLGVLTVPTLSFGAGATLNLETGTGGASEKVVVSTAGGLTFSNLAVNLLIDGTANGSLSGTYTILEFSGALGGSVSNLSVANARPGYTYTFASTGSAITLTVLAPDSDGDGMDNDWETANGLNPNDATGVNGADGNADGDFSTNYEEYLAGTNPQDPLSDPANSDADDLPDDWEMAEFGNLDQIGSGDFDGDYDTNLQEYTNNTIPTLASDYADTDDDGMGDGWEIYFFTNLSKNGSADSDSDGFTDLREWTARTDPTSASYSPISPKLAHRWNFNGNLLDTGVVGGSPATIMPGDTSSTNLVTQTTTGVNFAGGTKATSQWVRLGSNLLPEKVEPVTFELWATSNAIQNWSRVLSIHNSTKTAAESLFMSWTQGTTAGTNRVNWTKNGGALGEVNNSMQLTVGTEFHIILSLEPVADNADATKITWYAADALLGSLGAAKGTFTANQRITSVDDAVIALGRSWWGDNAPSASYNEVRLYQGVLPEWIREGLHSQGSENPMLVDTDNGAGADGLPDAWEDWYFFGDFSYGPGDDPDNDGFTNQQELIEGTDPNNADSAPGDVDGDGLPDAWEIENFGDITTYNDLDDPDGDYEDNLTEFQADTDPNSFFSFTDANANDIADGWEAYFNVSPSDDGSMDVDGDGFTTLDEFELQADPNDPLKPGVANGDADNDGLPDRWEVLHFNPVSLLDVQPTDNPDGDADNNLAEYKATSDPNNANSTAADINGDGEADVFSFLPMESTGSGLLDIDSEATSFTNRLAGSGSGLAVPDVNLDLDTTSGTLELVSTATDINGQVNMAQLEAIGIPLSSLGFTGTEDFRVRAHYVNMPAMDGFDQIGVYVGTSTTAMIRGGVINGTHQALGVNTNGNNDSDGNFGAANASATARDMTVVIERIGGIWAITVNGNAVTPGVQPAFLNGLADLQAGIFALHQTSSKLATLDSFTLVRFGQSTADADADGMDDSWEITHFGSAGARDGTGDADGDGMSDLEEFAFNGNPISGSSQGEGSFSTVDSNANSQRDLTLTVAVRAGATFAAGAGGAQTASIGGITYTIRGSADLVNWTTGVTHVGTSAATDAAWELHTFRLNGSDGLPGRGFLDAQVSKP